MKTKFFPSAALTLCLLLSCVFRSNADQDPSVPVPPTVPNLTGTWKSDSLTVTVTQNDSAFTATVSDGRVFGGVFTSVTAVHIECAATGQKYDGTVGADRIDWAGGYVWTRQPMFPNLIGTWKSEVLTVTVTQSNSTFTASVSDGRVFGGVFTSSNGVHIECATTGQKYDGTVGTDRIDWVGGRLWTRE